MINVAGHQLSAKHLEAAALTVEDVAEAAAVPVHDAEHGWLIEMYVVLQPAGEPGEETDTVARITTAIERETGRIAGPKNVWIVAGMPKNRAGEIMRHVLAAISNFTDAGDTGTPATDIERHVHAAKLERGEKPAKLTPKQIEEIRAFGRPD
ncbi:acyl-coenzyme A synthetase/AMP-(fatty) acid ligase [Catenulispora sp. GP43]|uniref:AMP-binding enzyme n=1 Tax=Catenulispora sp. GP43 TaxID=3156263 RepID=UPI0035123210